MHLKSVERVGLIEQKERGSNLNELALSGRMIHAKKQWARWLRHSIYKLKGGFSSF
jgi:hypothetical protein